MPTTVSRRLTALRRRVARFIDPDPGARQRNASHTPAVSPGPRVPATTPGVLTVSGLPPLRTRVGIGAGPRLRRVMADEWQQVELLPHAPAPSDLDLVLLELRGDTVPGWEHQATAVAYLVQDCVERSLPVAVWVTGGRLIPPDWIGEATVLAAATPSLRTELEALARRPVELLEAAAQPRRHRPVGPPHTRSAALVTVEGGEGPAIAALGNLIHRAIDPMPTGEVSVVSTGPRDEPAGPIEAAVKRPVEHLEWALLEPDLGARRVVVDLSSVADDGPWTSIAAAASATPLVGIDATGTALPESVAALVPHVEEDKQLRSELVARLEQTELVAREGLRLQRSVLSSHTAAHRAQALLARAGLDTTEAAARRSPSISAVVPTNRIHELDNIFANLGRQSHTDRELVLVLHGLDAGSADLRARAAEAGIDNLVVLEAHRSLSLGACMNLGVEAASGRYIAKMDDDNFYGTHFLSDLLDAFSYTDAGIVGKWCHYVWLRASNAVVLRYPDSEHRPERRIQGGSMVFDGDVVRGLRFSDIPRAVDSDILDRATAEGITIYSADRFNYVSVRGTDRTAHTWSVTDSTFMTKTGRLQFFGDPRPHVSV